jgi:hypothetical protein
MFCALRKKNKGAFSQKEPNMACGCGCKPKRSTVKKKKVVKKLASKTKSKKKKTTAKKKAK